MVSAPAPFHIIKHTVPSQHIREYARATSTVDGDLDVVVNQYIPKSNHNPQWGDVTIHCYSCYSSIMPWSIIAMVNHFRGEMIRPIVGTGHSMGAGQLVLASLIHPRLFTSLILLEPVIGTSIHECQGPALTRASTFRRDTWPSLEEADERVLQRWIEYGYRAIPTVAHQDTVTLATTKHQGVFSYLRPNFKGIQVVSNPITQQHDRSDHIVVPVILAVGTDPLEKDAVRDIIDPVNATAPFYRAEPVIAYLGLRKAKLEKTGMGVGGSGGAKEQRVKEVVISRDTHLVPFEAVAECANAVSVWIEDEIKQWKTTEMLFIEGRESKSPREKVTVTPEWMERINNRNTVSIPLFRGNASGK
ncbi:hypothetical protein BDV96DRAFT_608510 [Lophiotrema nucula]|uniref:Uncharacterized protein n=1 Tax=Lophiotrema nucula TaxID=690887 RepID=A0A6A5ZUH1_9PLEO|nr:hypothetical protein BDV96DRAFT_608510 [Lophiotrema nucula]